MSESTALTAPVGLPARAPTDEDIEAIRKKGKQLTAYKKEVNELYRTLEGLEWGSGSQAVKGSSFSPQTRYALAEFIRVTRANPQHHVDILGGKPYLNANYWRERIVNDPMYVDLQQRDITEATEKRLRAMAAERREAHLALKDTDPSAAAQQLTKALDLEEEADYVARARLHWSPPAWATSAYETVIRRFMNAAPMDAIRAGRISMEEADRWIIEVKECNWAGNRPEATKRRKDGSSYTYQPDPIGNDEPEKTARTRSLRRCATQAFSAWMEQYEAQIRKAEEAIEAEWEIVQEDRSAHRASLPSSTGPQGVSTSAGEPGAASPNGASPLPVDGEPARTPEPAPSAPTTVPDPKAEPSDLSDLRKRFFATFRDAGHAEAQRKQWAKDHGLPESTQAWTKEDFERAQAVLVGPVEKKVRDGCEIFGVDLADLSLQVLGKEAPDFLKDWQQLDAELQARADA